MEDIDFNGIVFNIGLDSSFIPRFLNASTHLTSSTFNPSGSLLTFIRGVEGGVSQSKFVVNSSSLSTPTGSLIQNGYISNNEINFNLHNVLTTSSSISSSNQINRLSGLKYAINPLTQIFRLFPTPISASLSLALDGSFLKCFLVNNFGVSASFYMRRAN